MHCKCIVYAYDTDLASPLRCAYVKPFLPDFFFWKTLGSIITTNGFFGPFIPWAFRLCALYSCSLNFARERRGCPVYRLRLFAPAQVARMTYETKDYSWNMYILRVYLLY